MKLRILNYGIAASHGTITSLDHLLNPLAITDFDAFIFDPDTVMAQVSGAFQNTGHAAPSGALTEIFRRRQQETEDLLRKKAGPVICLLRPYDGRQWSTPTARGPNTFSATNYEFFRYIEELQKPSLIHPSRIYAGRGTTIRVPRSSGSAARRYFETLNGHLHFEAHFKRFTGEPALPATVLATDSIDNATAIQVRVGSGAVFFLPIPSSGDDNRTGAAMVETVRAFFSGETDTEHPSWASDVNIPGTEPLESLLKGLRDKQQELTAEIQAVEGQRQALQDHKKLLYGYGKGILEPSVRSAFRLLGFHVPEPEEYTQPWDAFLTEPGGVTAICEIEGSESAIAVRKYRQLLDYINDEVEGGKKHKGILAGNGFRLVPPEFEERKNQFTDQVLRGAETNKFCLLPTSELFKAVCAILEAKDSEELKGQIRDSILSTVGPWRFKTAE